MYCNTYDFFFCKRLLTKKIATIIISTQTSIRGLFVTLARFFYELSYRIVQWYWYLDNHSPRFLLFHQDLCLPILFFLILFFLIMTRTLNNSGLFIFFTTQRNGKAILGESDFTTIYWVFFSMEGDRNNQSL